MRLPVILSAVLALGLMEAVVYWWMNPEPAGYGDPVLTYRPQAGRDPALPVHLSPSEREADGESGIRDQEAGGRRQEETPAPGQDPALSSSPHQPSTINHLQSEFSSSSPNRSSYTLLPEIVSQSIPVLHCSTGTAARIDRDDGITVHVAFFQWDFAAFTNVYQAFRHLPEQCMGAIGMTLVKVHPPRFYDVPRGQESDVRGKGAANATAQSTSPTNRSISFDHTEFRNPFGWPIHVFKGVWISGSSDLLRDDYRGGAQQLREIRWESALKRFRPAHARVAQGAVHGLSNPDRAWEAFEEAMLRDLTFE